MSDQLQTLNQRIAERIGKELIDLIPPDQWQALVDAEVAKFRQETAPKIVAELLREAFKNQAIASVNHLTLTNEWDELTQTYINTKLKDFIGSSGGEIFAAVLSPAMTMVLSDLRNRLTNY